MDRVQQQVQHDLLQLDAVAATAGRLDASVDATVTPPSAAWLPSSRITSRISALRSSGVHSNCSFSQQPADALDHVARALVLLDDVVEDLAHLAERRRSRPS